MCSAVVLSACFAFAARADEANQPLQELFQSETIFPQEKDEIQFTSMPKYAQHRNGNLEVMPLGFEYGLTDAWQVEGNWDAFVSNREDGPSRFQDVGDLTLGLRHSWMDMGDNGLHTALGFDVTAPIASKNANLPDEGAWLAEPYGVAAIDLPKWTGSQLFVNASDEWHGGNDGRRNIWVTNFGFYGPIDRLTLTAEINLRGDQDNYATPGMIWRPIKGLEMGVGVPVGLSSQSDRYRVVLMLVREFEQEDD